MSAFFSGDPLPIAPTLGNGANPNIAASNFKELEVFNRKLLEYLRRLGLHLSNPDLVTTPSGTSGVESLVVVRISSNQTLGSDPDTLIFNQQLRADAPFVYDTTTGIVTIQEDGFYLFLVDLHFLDHSTYVIDFYDGTTTYPFGQTIAADAQVGTVFYSSSCAVPMHLHTDQTMQVRVAGANGSAIVRETMRMTVLKLGGFESTTPGGDDPCELDIWQLCA